MAIAAAVPADARHARDAGAVDFARGAATHFDKARREPLITLGSAPLDVPEFRSVVLGQLGESPARWRPSTPTSPASGPTRALDADTKGVLRDIHRRVGTTILFESSGGQVHKVAHLPELRFALGEPRKWKPLPSTTRRARWKAASFFIRKVGTDGFRIHHQATLKKVVSDRRASLDEETVEVARGCRWIRIIRLLFFRTEPGL